MPKKTREEKIMARLRRLEKAKEAVEVVQHDSSQTSNSSSFNLKTINQPTKKVEPSRMRAEVVDYSYVKTDLRKTIILTFAALLIEVGLSLFLSGKSIF